ncbi:thiol:disulfide interchange protein [Mycobacterium adipatum]|uniref:Thiol:disulfide interchange protein n=1 Tax=Mycobacterium adipatum TaxID=1682113 RepID=A0A172UQY2_9MYCO|nr:cytochrome c biogenesis protein DipZ [Mycobacterium adipatum]ANE81194.1 thiol:disulfide interchange protein [Mycobacterium adipatum]MBI5734680.1 cytochrome c biogenesis protein DipZ [Mycolicibacterium neoaurum]
MTTLVAIGFLGGLITGISPCILPVLPVIFFAGTPAGTTAPALSSRLRPYLVIAGLVVSFSLVTLAGSALLSWMRLPQDTIRWVALAALVAIGLGLIFPQFEALLEKPFSRLPQRQFGSGKGGFGLGLTLGVLYVPCAGPVLAAIVVAGATGTIGVEIIALTLSFAVGAALPLLFFALAGRRISERVAAFRRRQRTIRVVAGVVTILLAVALVFNLPAVLQRTIPDYTAALQEQVGGGEQLREQLDLGGLVNEQNAQLSNCTNGAPELESCGTAPDIRNITAWLNTPGGAPIELKSLRGKVVLIDFWAYSCINCQRAIPHLVDWYDAYRDRGLEVIGVHTPEYAFEKVQANVVSGAEDLGITYPIAMDNAFSTWTNYRNRYWPAHYLIDKQGVVRHIKFGEGDYATTEKLIRQLLSDGDDAALPAATERPDGTPTTPTTPETYFSVGKVVNYGGTGRYDEGTHTFEFPDQLAPDRFALRGPWALDYQGATAQSDGATIKLNYHARNVYLVVGGTGTVRVTRDGVSTDLPVAGPPNMRQIVADDTDSAGSIEVSLDEGLQAYSFTYG